MPGKQAEEGPARILPARCGQGGERCWLCCWGCSSPADDAVVLPQAILALFKVGDLASRHR